jgi:hypothetical protein
MNDDIVLGCDAVRTIVGRYRNVIFTAAKPQMSHGESLCGGTLHNTSDLKMEAVCFSETLVSIYESTRCQNPEEHSHNAPLQR